MQRCVQQLAGSSVSGNTMPGEQYRFPARNKQELLETQHLVADARTVGRKEKILDPAEKLEQPVEQPEARPSQPPASKGWLL